MGKKLRNKDPMERKGTHTYSIKLKTVLKIEDVADKNNIGLSGAVDKIVEEHK